MRSIVFVHGFGGEFAKTWTPFQKELQSRPEAQNWAFHKYEYPTRRVRLPLTDIAPYINRLAQGLRTEIRNRCNMSTHLLLCGYSMGGLVIRKYLIEALKLGDELPPRMACLCYATPHNGSGLAQVARFLSKDNPPAEQMRPGSEFLKQLNSDWSNLEVEKRVKTRFVVAALDTTVDSESAQGEWGTKNVEVLIDRDHSTAVKPIDGKEDLSVFIAANLMRELCDADSATMPSGNWLIARFEGRFSEIDKEINRVIPKGILSPRAHKYVRFESKHLLQSLLALGMPVRIAFEVVEVISDELVGAAEKLSEVSTRELRSFVSDAIHGLAPRGADDTAVDQWISGYTARYGHSDGRLVVEKNGVSYPLDYTSLKNVIVPDVIFRITGKKLDQIDTEIISGSAIGRMARYVLKGVNNFGVYELNYNSLLLMATDIAVKRPHPWFVQRSGHSDTVTYDLERSHRWASELMHTVRSGTRSAVKHAVGECVHHSASAILGFYGAFLGVGYLAPLRQLTRQLTAKSAGHCWEFCRIHRLTDDINALGQPVFQVLADLNWIKKYIHNISEDWYDMWVEKVAWLSVLAHRITHEGEFQKPFDEV